jgi:hypothetical protein
MMKLAASILVLYFGLLMVQPFYGMDTVSAKPAKSCGTKKCCKSKANKKQTIPCNNATDCNMDFCNPFVPCGINIAPPVGLMKFENHMVELSGDKKPTINEDITSDYLADCWRPPKLL